MEVLASLYSSTMSVLNGSDPGEDLVSQFNEGSILETEPNLSPVCLLPPLSPVAPEMVSPVLTPLVNISQISDQLGPKMVLFPDTSQLSDGCNLNIRVMGSEKVHTRTISKRKIDPGTYMCKLCRPYRDCTNPQGLASHNRCKHSATNSSSPNLKGRPKPIPRSLNPKPKFKKTITKQKFQCYVCKTKFITKKQRLLHMEKCCPPPSKRVKQRKSLCVKPNKKSTKSAYTPQQITDNESSPAQWCEDIVDSLVMELPIPSMYDALELAQMVVEDTQNTNLESSLTGSSGCITVPITPPLTLSVNEPLDLSQSANDSQSVSPGLESPVNLHIQTTAQNLSTPNPEIHDSQKLKSPYQSPTHKNNVQSHSWKARLTYHPLLVTEEEYIKDIPYPDILLISQGLVQKQIRGDGHCILRAVLEALSYTRSHGMSMDRILHLISSEVQDNLSHYTDKGESIPAEISDYIMDKQYTIDAADLIPGIVATALDINMSIVSINKNKTCDLIKIPPGRLEPFPPSKLRPSITLVRTNADAHNNISTHYDAAIPQTAIKKSLIRQKSSQGDMTLKCPHTNTVYHMFRSPSILSNFASVKISLKSGTFSCNEQNIMSNRFPQGHPSQCKIMNTDNPRVMKEEGKKAPKDLPKDITNAVKGMWAKYNTDTVAKMSLLTTKNHILVEGTHNRVWGVGRDISWDHPSIWADRTKWVTNSGVGILGLMSMVIREDIRNNCNSPSWDFIKILVFPPRDISPIPAQPPPPLIPPHATIHISSPTQATNDPPLYSDVIKSPAPQGSTITPRMQTRVLLPTKGMYIPPKHMSAKYVLAQVRESHPSLGHHLQIEEGKLTSVFPDVQHALKLPLLPLSGVLSLRHPLPRALPDNTHVQIWLTDPIAIHPFNPLLLAASPEVISITKYESDGDKVIFKVSTAFVAVENRQVQPTRRLIELKGGTCIQLTKFIPVERCTSCQSLDHNKWQCVTEYFTCVFCAGHHFSGRCPVPSKFNYKCGRCKGAHKASSVLCPDYIQKLEEQNLPSLGNIPDCPVFNNMAENKQVTPLLEGHLSEARMRKLFPGNKLNRIQKLFRRKDMKSSSPPLSKLFMPTPLMEVQLSEERIMHIFGHVSPQFQDYAPFPVKSCSNGVTTHNQSSRPSNQTRPHARLARIACDLFEEGHIDTVVSVLSEMCGKKADTLTQFRHITQNLNIRKLFQEASPEFVSKTILPILEDACNSLHLKNNNQTPTFPQYNNPNLIYINTTDELAPSPRCKNPNLIQIETSN